MKQSIFNVIIVLMTIKSNSGLIPLSDFYIDQSPVSTSSDGFNGCDNYHSGQLPKSITNIRGYPSVIYQSYNNEENGVLFLHGSFDFFIIAWFSNWSATCFKGDSFNTTISNNSQLLQRARDDITSIYDVDPNEVTPEYLIVSQFNDARVNAAEGEGTTYQIVIATNGEYTYAIIQFASVESGLAGNHIVAFIGDYLSYSSDPSQAGNGGTNPDIPGKYIIDLNDNPPPLPPPPCPSCEKRIESVICQLLRRKAESDGSTVPRPCQG